MQPELTISRSFRHVTLWCVLVLGALWSGSARAQDAALKPAPAAVSEIEAGLAKAGSLTRSGRTGDALEVYWSTFRSAAHAHGINHPKSLEVARSIAGVYRTLGQYDEAIALHRNCFATIEPQILSGEIQSAPDLAGLAGALTEVGKFEEAREVVEETLGTRRKRLGEKHAAVASAYQILGDAHMEEHEFESAEIAYRESLKIREEILDDSDPDLAETLLSLGTAVFKQDRFYDAQPIYERALTVTKRAFQAPHPRIAEAQFRVGVIYRLQRKKIYYRVVGDAVDFLTQNPRAEYARAIQAYLDHFGAVRPRGQAVHISHEQFEKFAGAVSGVFGKHHPLYAATLFELGGRHLDRTNPLEAVPAFTKALGLIEGRHGECEKLAEGLIHLGNAYRLAEDEDQAEKSFRRSLKIYEKLGGPTPSKEHVSVTIQLGDVLLKKGNADEGWELIERGMRMGKGRMTEILPGLPETDQINFVSREMSSHFYNAVFHAIVVQNQGKAPPGLAENVAEWAINLKALANEALAAREILGRGTVDPTTKLMVGELAEIRNAIAQLEGGGATLFGESPLTGMLRSLHNRLNWLSSRVGAETELDDVSGRWVGVDEIRKSLDPDTVLVMFVQYAPFVYARRTLKMPSYAAVVIPPEGKGDVALVPVHFSKALEEHIDYYLHIVEGTAHIEKDPKNPFARPNRMDQATEALSDLILKNIKDRIGGFERWLIVPDEELWLVPFPALFTAKGRFVIEDHEVGFLNSARDLIRKRAVASKEPAAVFADPDYDLSAPGDARIHMFSRLPGTATEAAAVVPQLEKLTGKKPAVFTRAIALEKTVKKVNQPSFLVLSTHGFFDENTKPFWEIGRNPLLRCGLALSGANARLRRKPGEDDGILTGMEVLGIDLRGTRLVVLSACQTGLGETRSGEGIAGLRRSFQLAGAESVISTLWSIPDAETAELMTDLFTTMAKGETPAKSLRAAQLAMIKQRREAAGIGHPIYWAAFVLNGAPH